MIGFALSPGTMRRFWCGQVLLLALLYPLVCQAEVLSLNWLVGEALKNNRELLAAQSRLSAYEKRIPQAGSLPDPMLSVGYQNDGSSEYTYGDSPDAKWMFEVSQTFPFAGKRGLRTDMARTDLAGRREDYEALRRRTIRTVREAYLDLFLTHKSLDIYAGKGNLLNRIEEAALSRYASGTVPQRDVVMAQTEKYMLREKEEMARQRIETLEGTLNLVIGRDAALPLGRPADSLEASKFEGNLNALIDKAYANAAEIRVREKMVTASELKVGMSKREFFPDITLNAGYEQRGSDYTDMYKLSASFNLPVYFKTRQEPAVQEASDYLLEAKHDLAGTKFMIASTIRENLAAVSTADHLMALYRNALIPKTSQDFQASLSAYETGKAGVETVVGPLKSALDYELLYWSQLVEREKAIARIDALTGDNLDRYGPQGE
jgi:outer membrane protein, heavy metal efflux system